MLTYSQQVAHLKPNWIYAPRRCLSQSNKNVLINVSKANVYRFGDVNSSTPLFRGLEWLVQEGESWAIVGSGSGEKSALFKMLLGHLRISPHPPPPGGLFPFLSETHSDPLQSISIVSFGNRRRTSGGAFYDYSARYGAVQEEDRVTLRQNMFPETMPREKMPYEDDSTAEEERPILLSEKERRIFDELVGKMGLESFLDLPMIALSNGQTRRARILKAIMTKPKPELLLLDEPLTGLDVNARPKLLDVLHSLHQARSPRVIMGLRTQDTIPDWITHVASVKGNRIAVGDKTRVMQAELERSQKQDLVNSQRSVSQTTKTGDIVVDLQNVRVQYQERKVLKNLNWQIRQGERWHLQGENGSGKTTLLSLLTGDHPQSYTQLASTSSHLHLFGKPRSRIPTPQLQSMIGVLSPEIFDAFPRRPNMSVWDVIGTGFDGGYVPKGKRGVGAGVMDTLTDEDIDFRVRRVEEVLEHLGPEAWARERREIDPESLDSDAQKALRNKVFAAKPFVDLSIGEQRMVLLMRALVGRAKLVLLDEVWSGMDESMVRVARRYLRSGGVGDEQAVVVITHWEEEVPWTVEDGLKRFKLDKGEGRVF
ncbi:P-loop containing nucleoside triphosphate hydrolase protein [Dendrothele bispora CBS 962.96]|uniref:P-loop containing nucleoside triphosphate hydrolase protein n=1 Tax=Dendrothele bispora (strain CBS 962.96) TaxID=1314807 RepID=A0A4S8LI96_DENBC|nr:P-loop containing nucleoside triphosphate hydrolase protein [Dendrothele bispora CBS 962.96]